MCIRRWVNGTLIGVSFRKDVVGENCWRNLGAKPPDCLRYLTKASNRTPSFQGLQIRNAPAAALASATQISDIGNFCDMPTGDEDVRSLGVDRK
jgi:hypothetical protein